MSNLAISNNLQGLYRDGAQISLYVADLGAYNAGYLRGVWVSLPLEDNELEALYNMAEELAIHDYECDFMEINEYDNIQELNELASELENLEDWELEAFTTYMKEVDEDVDRAFSIVRDGAWTTYYDCHDMEQVAMEYVEQIGGVSEVRDKEYYFDTEAFGRDLEIEGYNPYDTCGCHDEDCEYCQEARRVEEEGELDYDEIAQELFDEGCVDECTLERYFDYEALGRDMELDCCSTFAFTEDGNCIEFHNY